MQSARIIVETEEMKPKQRQSLRALVQDFARWSGLVDTKPQGLLAEMILEESGYTDMWRKDRTAEAAGRLENLKELVRSMEEFPDLASFLEHISLVMDAADKGSGERVSIGTGKLADAFRASASVPMVFSPMKLDGRVLVDGGVSDPVPAEIVNMMGADLCIAVNVVPPLKKGVEV